jgi:hypothetical protein
LAQGGERRPRLAIYKGGLKGLDMDGVGISFKSPLSPDEIRTRYVEPLRAALEGARAGIYSNYLRQIDADPATPPEHLLVFQVHDFKTGLHLLRLRFEEIGPPEQVMFHNLDPSEPMY